MTARVFARSKGSLWKPLVIYVGGRGVGSIVRIAMDVGDVILKAPKVRGLLAIDGVEMGSALIL
jgi:hypothetical protein